jgi:hypothetical protein
MDAAPGSMTDRGGPQERQRFSASLKCPNCDAAGSAQWEESGSTDRTRGSERTLIGLLGEFHAETGRTNSGDPVIVCNACDEIQPD